MPCMRWASWPSRRCRPAPPGPWWPNWTTTIPCIRAATARVIGRLGVHGAADQLAVALLDSSPVVRQCATEALGQLHDAESGPTLRDQFAKARGELVETTLLALARIGAPQDVAPLSPAADRPGSPDSAGRRPRARTGLATGRLIPPLQALLKTDKAPEVRLAAAFALQRLGQS